MYRVKIEKDNKTVFDKTFQTLSDINLGDYGFPQFEVVPNTALQEILSEKIWNNDPAYMKQEMLDLEAISGYEDDYSLLEYDSDKVLSYNLAHNLETVCAVINEIKGNYVIISKESDE